MPMVNAQLITDKLLVDIMRYTHNVNYCGKTKDFSRNRVNYGYACQCADMFRFLGHDVQLDMWEDDGFFKIERLIINGKTFFNQDQLRGLAALYKIADTLRETGDLPAIV